MTSGWPMPGELSVTFMWAPNDTARSSNSSLGKPWSSYHIFIWSYFQRKGKSLTFKKGQALSRSSTQLKKYQWVIISIKGKDLKNVCHEASKKFFNWNIAIFVKDQMRWIVKQMNCDAFLESLNSCFTLIYSVLSWIFCLYSFIFFIWILWL